MLTSRKMWAAVAIALAVLALPRSAAAQFGANTKFLGAHVGVSGVGSATAIGVSGELAYNERISIGAWADTWSYGESVGTALGEYSWDIRYIAIAGTGSYHFPIKSSPKWDPFVGLALGYYVVSSEARGFGGVTYDGDASRIFLGGFGGARYFFNPRLSGVARLGFGAAYLTLGVDMKL
jgi:hypothetical protein